MSDTKHTPGPWHIQIRESRAMPGMIIQDGVYGPDGEQIRVHGMTLTASDEAKANARLIAAAPDMLTALETVLAGGHLNTGEQAIVANAIAKATGKSIDEVLRIGG
ncbi:hypothetical protein CIW54_07550 [Paraburkholderia sp. T12-10]|nr:hypothetical protein CIW54_07550 [Paraburkholderia sp. T12-10]